MHLPAGDKAIAGDIDFAEAPHTQEHTSEPEEPKINLDQLVSINLTAS
jgi:hypothetical protein